MDDFTSRVVANVLSGGASGEHTRENAAFRRPNYQREKAKKRIHVYDLPPIGSQERDERNEGTDSAESPAGPYPEMRRLALGKPPEPAAAPVSSASYGPSRAEEFSCGQKSVCRSAAHPAVSIRFLPEVDRRVARMLQLSCRSGDAVGLAYASECRVSCLFAADEILAASTGFSGSLEWEGRFLLKLTGRPEPVKKALDAFSSLLREGVFVSRSPSSLLQRCLKLSGRQAVAAADCDRYADYLAYVNRYYKIHSDTMLDFSARNGRLLVQGDEEEAKTALENFLSGAEQ